MCDGKAPTLNKPFWKQRDQDGPRGRGRPPQGAAPPQGGSGAPSAPPKCSRAGGAAVRRASVSSLISGPGKIGVCPAARVPWAHPMAPVWVWGLCSGPQGGHGAVPGAAAVPHPPHQCRWELPGPAGRSVAAAELGGLLSWEPCGVILGESSGCVCSQGKPGLSGNGPGAASGPGSGSFHVGCGVIWSPLPAPSPAAGAAPAPRSCGVLGGTSNSPQEWVNLGQFCRAAPCHGHQSSPTQLGFARAAPGAVLGWVP